MASIMTSSELFIIRPTLSMQTGSDEECLKSDLVVGSTTARRNLTDKNEHSKGKLIESWKKFCGKTKMES